VLIQRATEEDIEALFARLNNGEPLNAAEKRNAMGGDAVRLVRAIAGRPFFAERLHFSNARHHHYELAARLLVTSATDPTGRTAPDLRASAIDAFVRSHRSITAPERDRLTAILDGGLDRMTRVFGPRDPLLSSPSYALLYFLFLGSGAAADVPAPLLREFFAAFQHDRLAALEQPEDGRDETLVEFSGLMQHGAQDPRAIARRLEILRSAWLAYRAAPTASGSPTTTVSAASPT
jgi:hypothetical protein